MISVTVWCETFISEGHFRRALLLFRLNSLKKSEKVVEIRYFTLAVENVLGEVYESAIGKGNCNTEKYPLIRTSWAEIVGNDSQKFVPNNFNARTSRPENNTLESEESNGSKGLYVVRLPKVVLNR